ncbi:MAG TPA: hypothetical protein VJM74_02420 [Nitrososphaeraceae archaeon]|jgi:hypothetical protein|nr:hypothetical protein [Nitrososphaeraceae archaeon]
MENITKTAADTASAVGEKVTEKVAENASQWTDIMKEVVDKLTGKNMQVVYDFQDFEVDVPKATGPEGKELGSAKWKINGKFTLSTELRDESYTR